MDARSVPLHPDFPRLAWVVVEQPRSEAFRMAFDPATGRFSRCAHGSLFHARGFASGDYGWIGGSGTPPAPHHDVIFLTDRPAACGEIRLGHVCGVFLRQDGDHKFVAVDDELRRNMRTADLACLSDEQLQALRRLYPRVDEGEGWFGADAAHARLLAPPH